MKWVVLVIILSIGVYTVLTLRYRRPERAFQPYQDLRDRANTHRLLDAGFQRITLTAELPADPQSVGTAARAVARRAERRLIVLPRHGKTVRPLLLRYLNRVSDLLWLMAREAEAKF